MPETLIVRLPNWLGDTVMAVPAVRALRRARPHDRLVLAGPWTGLFQGQGLADLLVAYPRTWTGRRRAAETIRALRPDSALLLPNSLEAAVAAWYWRARARVGFATGGRSWLLTLAVPVPEPRRHQIDEYRELAGALGAAAGEDTPQLAPPPLDAPERQAARALIAEALGEGRGQRRLIGVHLGAAFGPSKLWPVDRLAEFCAEVGADDAVPLLLGTPRDLPVARAVLARTRAPSVVGRDQPALLPALLAELDLLVCGDTGVGHLAAALGTPVIALFGPTDPALSAPRGPALVLRRPPPCAPCFYRTCPIDHPCLRAITAGDVRAAAAALGARAGAGALCA